MQDAVFNELADLGLQGSGQSISRSRAYLIEARLAKISRREGFGSLDDLVHCIKSRNHQALKDECAAALVNKDTWFFRERDMLNRLIEDILPKRAKAAQSGRLKIWVAGGGTGQEAYSIAMQLHDASPQGLSGVQIDILSTDLCKASTERARAGVFGHYEAQRGLSIHRLMQHFTRDQTGQWQLSDDMRRRVSFRAHNLLESAAGLGKFDVILCRNVLKGMARSARVRVIESLAAQLNPGGTLLTSETENIFGITNRLEPVSEFTGAWVAAGTANAAANAA